MQDEQWGVGVAVVMPRLGARATWRKLTWGPPWVKGLGGPGWSWILCRLISREASRAWSSEPRAGFRTKAAKAGTKPIKLGLVH